MTREVRALGAAKAPLATARQGPASRWRVGYTRGAAGPHATTAPRAARQPSGAGHGGTSYPAVSRATREAAVEAARAERRARAALPAPLLTRTVLDHAGLASAGALLTPAHGGFTLPRLTGVPLGFRLPGGAAQTLPLAAALLREDVADPAWWAAVGEDAGAFVEHTLRQTIGAHGGERIAAEFEMHAALVTALQDWNGVNVHDETNPTRCLLTIEPSAFGVCYLGGTLDLLAEVERAWAPWHEEPRRTGQPIPDEALRLPAASTHGLIGAINQWVRVYDWRDADDRRVMLTDWYEGCDEEGVELPDVEADTPVCVRAPRYDDLPRDDALGHIAEDLARAAARWPACREAAADEAPDGVKADGPKADGTRGCRPPLTRADVATAARILREIVTLGRVAASATRSEWPEALLENTDLDVPGPALCVAFQKEDAIVALCEEELQGFHETMHAPNHIVVIDPTVPGSTRAAFDQLVACCDTLDHAARLFGTLPGNGR